MSPRDGRRRVLSREERTLWAAVTKAIEPLNAVAQALSGSRFESVAPDAGYLESLSATQVSELRDDLKAEFSKYQFTEEELGSLQEDMAGLDLSNVLTIVTGSEIANTASHFAAIPNGHPTTQNATARMTGWWMT